MTRAIRVLIADDHTVVRLGLATMLKYQKGFTVIGEAEDGEEAVTRTQKTRPDVVIMDLMMPGIGGAEATRRIHDEMPNVRILILTSFATAADIAQAVQFGASGAVVKDADQRELLHALKTVSKGGSFFSPEIKSSLKEQPPSITLTQRQLDILHSASRGLSNPEIAKQFGISRDMVKHHLSAIFAKLGAATRAEAITIALRRQLLKA